MIRIQHAGLAGLASMLLGVGAAIAEPLQQSRRYLPVGRRTPTFSKVPAGINRHTGKPHENKREMARRVRQMQKIAG